MKATDGQEVIVEAVPHDNGEDWADVVLTGIGVAGAVIGAVTIPVTAPLWAVAGASIGAVAGMIALSKEIAEALNPPSHDLRVRPAKLCPTNVGSTLVWWSNPAGDPLTVSDAFSVCSCGAAVGGSIPERCRGQGQREAQETLSCAQAPYSTPGETELCAEILHESHPEIDRGRAAASMCGYKDCGAFAHPSYSAATDVCGCSTGGGIGGGIWVPDFGWTDPLPIPSPVNP